jgi:hypothetical protein
MPNMARVRSEHTMSQQKPPQRKKRHWARNIFLGIIGLIALIIVIAVVTSRGGGVSTTSSGTAGTPSPSATHVAAPARLGSYLDVQDSAGDTYEVALIKIIDPARSTDQITPDNGKRFVGAVFTIKAISGDGPQQEDSENAAALVGSGGQTYIPDIIPITGYTDFAVGEIHATPGGSTTGAVTFQVPTGVKVSKVQWSSFSSFGVRSTVQWNVPQEHPGRTHGGASRSASASPLRRS